MYKFNCEKIEISEKSKNDLEVLKIVDDFESQLLELFLIRNPQFRFNKDYKESYEKFSGDFLKTKDSKTAGNWFFFPWNKTLIHYLPEEEYFEVRTARNKNLITNEEQVKYYNSTIAIAGLSVGSHAALTLAMTGGAKNLKLADFDNVSVSNLNRLRYGASVLGENKALIAARIIAEINPYSNIYIYDDGITEANIEDFVTGSKDSPKSDFIIEGVDNLEMKIRLREAAKKNKLPLIMATDNGDGIIVDVERYDVEQDLSLFNGAIGNFTLEDFKNFPPQELPKLATKVAGPDFIVPRMLGSLLQVGRTLYSWPQLGTAATFTGVASAYLTRAILNGRPIKSGKYDLNLESFFDQTWLNSESMKKIDEERKDYLKKMGL